MYFHKCHQPENFAFPVARDGSPSMWKINGKSFRYRWSHLGEDVYRLRIDGRRWADNPSQAAFDLRFDRRTEPGSKMHPVKGLGLRDPKGGVLLESEPGRVFGVSGQAWLMQFASDKAMRFYGMGEKVWGIEHTGRFTKFWNTDVWADFDSDHIIHRSPDPAYVSIPYLIVKRGNRYAGVLVNNPYAVFMSINPKVRIADQADADDGKGDRSRFYIGSPDGEPDVFFIVGPTLRDLTCKLQRLVGTTPLPPMWALGHHQCRWGYAGFKDLDRIDQTYARHGIPNDGLWVDIDYMRGFRVFTWDDAHWPKLKEQVAALQSRGRRVLPILDPGVKVDKRFDVYKSGVKADAFCKNPSGGEFVGFVWPGATAFPDFSMQEGRDWWSAWTRKRVAELGITGVWIDMNDPSTGPSENGEMLFDRGRLSHDAFHNQYATGMARATHDALRQSHPDARPFVLSRSGSTSINRYAALWTGDNYANEHHMRLAIPTTLNLALSGVPFNGPDVGGFGGDTTAGLVIAWYKAGFLFPFLRNHTAHGTRDQEPWAFGQQAMRIVRRYIRLRYKLLPYLYNLFVRQEQTGEAILRPLMYGYKDTRSLPLDRIGDQFMVGPSIMQAPVLDVDGSSRRVVLPKGRWFDAAAGKWIEGGRSIKVTIDASATPLYIPDGSVIPMRPGEPKDNRTDLADIELHLFISPGYKGRAEYTYHADDGETYAYQRGGRTTIGLKARRDRAGLTLRTTKQAEGFGPLRVRLVTYGRDRDITVVTEGDNCAYTTRPRQWRFAGVPIACQCTKPIQL